MVDQFRNLKDLYREILALRSRVRQAERASGERLSPREKPQSNRARNRERSIRKKQSK
jgi:hypothetical protein